MTEIDIKAVRESLGESQAEFAARFGVSQATICRWEVSGVPEHAPTMGFIRQIISGLPENGRAV